MVPHIPVMMEEYLKCFEGVTIRSFFDGTLGAGGHAKALLESHPEIEMYIGCDRDESALEIAKDNLAPWKDKLVLKHGNFADLDTFLQEMGIKQIDGFFLTWGFLRCN